jgi:small-conductance mechanosensitive channel
MNNMLTDLLRDLRDPSVLWQAGAIALCLGLGWTLSRLLRRSYLAQRDPEQARGVQAIGRESFAHVLSPLLTLVLLYLAGLALGPLVPRPTLLRLAVPLLQSLVLIRLAFFLLRRVFARHSPVGSAILTFERIFALAVWAGVATYITGLWPELLATLQSNAIPLGKHEVSIWTIIKATLSVAVLLMLALWAGATLEERLMGMEGMHTSLRVVLARMSRAVLILVSVLVSLSLVGIDLTVLSVFGGALGVGLGLGLQKIASNYVSGFIILLERSLGIGDMITVDKYSGKVARINTRYTVLQGLDGVETVIPNEMLVSGAVQNQSLSTRRVRYGTAFVVTHDSDLDEIIPLLLEAPKGVPRVLEDPGPHVSLNRFTNDGYELELGIWVNDPENGRGGVMSEVNKRVYALVRAGKLKLAFPARDAKHAEAQVQAALSAQTQAGNTASNA